MAQKFKLKTAIDGGIYIAPCSPGDDGHAVGNFAETKRKAIAENRAKMKPYVYAIRRAKSITAKKASRADFALLQFIEG